MRIAGVAGVYLYLSLGAWRNGELHALDVFDVGNIGYTNSFAM